MKKEKRLLAPCAKPVENSGEISLLPAELITNLLLFDEYIVESCKLMEFPQMISTFGFEPVLELLQSRCLRIKCDANLFVIMSTAEETVRSGNPYFYDFSVIRSANYEEYLRSCFKHLRKRADLHEKMMKKLKREIRSNLDNSGDPYVFDSPELKAARNLMEDLESNRPGIRDAVSLELRTKYQMDIRPTQFSLRFHRVGEDKFKAETDLTKKTRLSELDAHTVIQDAIFRLSSINQSIAYMEHYNALTSFNEQDLAVLDSRLSYLIREVRPDEQIGRFKRVLGVKGFPDFESLIEQKKFSLEKILELRETKECQEFRDWLSTLDSTTDAEIAERLESFSIATGNFVTSTSGKVIRFLVLSILGLIPGVNIIANTAISALDTFLLEKVFPTSGPISFINNKLPAAFDFYNNKDSRKLLRTEVAQAEDISITKPSHRQN